MSITARAARVDLQVARGADFGKAVQIWTPDVQARADSLIKGQRVWYDGLPEEVYAVRIEPNRVTVSLRDGVFTDPWFQVSPGHLVFTAKQRAITWAKAGYKLLKEPEDGWDVTHVEIPNQITANTVQMAIPAVDTLKILPGPYSWDLVCDVEGVRMRLMEGVLICMTAHAVEPDYVFPPTDATAYETLPG